MSSVSGQPPSSYTPAHLAERIQAEREALEARATSDGERKSITALFADIKGSTDLIADLDPEEARAILDPTLKLMMDAVHRYEGYVAQSLGDGIFALFGAPIAHEDHPQRALYAALKMQEDVRQHSDRLRQQGHTPLQIRVGINTGEVVLRSIRKDDLHTDYVPVGQSTNLASRMESLATPGSILVSENTYKLTEGYFDFKPLGQTQVKGFPERVSIYEVTGVGLLRTKLQLSVKRGLARFVGRQNEMVLLQQALDQAKAAHGQIAGVMGEPGVGKSRLFYEFKVLSQRGCLVLETFSVSHGKAYPYLPLIDLLKNYFQLTTQDDERQRREKITGKVLALDRSLEDTLPYLCFLLGIADQNSPLQQMDGQVRRTRILEAIKRLLLRESLNQPVIIIFEDLHWLDTETQAFLQVLSESVASARVLLLVNYRPEYQAPWHGKTYFSPLRLDPLGHEHAAEMLATLLGEDGTSTRSRLHQFILDKTEGNPFFMEEIIQTLREQGLLHDGRHAHALQPTDLRIPTTVQGVLSARIDRLPPKEKSLLQTLAVLGREFSSTLLRNVVTQPEPELLALLARLQAGEFVYEQPAFPDTEYIFKHALTQEVAYTSLLIERRKVLHERTAQAIEEVYRVRLDDHYSELAYHYSRSGNTQKAVDYLQLAGQQAVRRSAHEEAVTHFSNALDFLYTLPENQERNQKELALQTALGVPLFSIKGLAAQDVGRVYTRARELCQQISDPDAVFPALWGLAAFHWGLSEWKTARQLGEQLRHIAEQTQDRPLLIEAYQSLGISLFWLGEFPASQHYLEKSFALYDATQHRSLASTYGGYDPGIAALTELVLILWLTGYPQQALEKSQFAFFHATELKHPNSQGIMHIWSAFFYQLRRDAEQARDHAAAAISLATAQGFVNWIVMGGILHGWAIAMLGQRQAGIEEIEKNLADQQRAGFALIDTYSYALLSEVYQQDGNSSQAESWLTKAFETLPRNGQHMYEAELYRLKGDLMLQKLSVGNSQLSVLNPQPLTPSTQAEAEKCFLKALDVAQKQRAKSLELRATMSLARLWQSEGKQREAHQMLSEIYNCFTEGFDTKDLQEAKALLAVLSEPSDDGHS